ncbi:MAG: hypothetical protein D6796_13830 [Caldilineae bacterium]|nr:MAG: hypothetical protein D6796_13830 [Caldilineae bacterium]
MREQLHRNLTDELQRRLSAATRPQVRNLALLTQALVFSENCHLPNLALQLPIEGRRDSLIQRLVRFLDNGYVTWSVHYRPLVADLLAHWPDREINLLMDRTDIEGRKSILLLAVAFKHRALPLTWQVLPFGGTGEGSQVALLEQIRPLLPSGKRTMFFGDSEFRAVGLQRYCRNQGWDWQVGVKSDTLFRQGETSWRPLSALTIQPGQRHYFHHITLTRSAAFPAIHLMVDWTWQGDAPRYVVCNQPTNGRSWRRGRKRFWIEPTFRDWKSYGFDLETTHLSHDHRLDHLLLAMAVATLWLIHLGHWAVTTQRDKWLVAPHRRDYSLFRLGRDYARRSQIRGWPLPISFRR